MNVKLHICYRFCWHFCAGYQKTINNDGLNVVSQALAYKFEIPSPVVDKLVAIAVAVDFVVFMALLSSGNLFFSATRK